MGGESGEGVLVGNRGVLVGNRGVLVGNRGVLVGNRGVLVGNRGKFVKDDRGAEALSIVANCWKTEWKHTCVCEVYFRYSINSAYHCLGWRR